MGRAIVEACLPWIGLLVAAVFCAWLLARLSGARMRLSRLRLLHRDQEGAVQSLAFVLVLPFFVMIMLFIIQVSQITIGTVLVHYSAFAAARSAVVWIPACVPGEPENCVGMHLRQDGVDESQMSEVDVIEYYNSDSFEPTNGYAEYVIVETDGAPIGRGSSPKLRKIFTAAVMACMPICPSRDVGPSSQGGDPNLAAAIQAMYLAMSPGSAYNTRIGPRINNKLSYAIENTALEMRFYHSKQEPPLLPYWYVGVVDSRGQPIGYQFNEMAWQDHVEVTVYHKMALLPGPGRFLAKKDPNLARDRVAETILKEDNVYKYLLHASAMLGNEGERSVIPYVYAQN